MDDAAEVMQDEKRREEKRSEEKGRTGEGREDTRREETRIDAGRERKGRERNRTKTRKKSERNRTKERQRNENRKRTGNWLVKVLGCAGLCLVALLWPCQSKMMMSLQTNMCIMNKIRDKIKNLAFSVCN